MNHKWDYPEKWIATCIKCGVTRYRANWRYCEKWWYAKKGKNEDTLIRPNCKNSAG